jgi:hypothetical protein
MVDLRRLTRSVRSAIEMSTCYANRGGDRVTLSAVRYTKGRILGRPREGQWVDLTEARFESGGLVVK